MLFKTKQKNIIPILFAVLLCVACSKNPEQEYSKEADALCGIHNLDNLNMLLAKTSAIDHPTLIAGAIKKEIKSKEFKDVFERLSTSGYRNFYAALQPEISKLIGKEWLCEDMQKFYDITWVSSNTPKDPSGINKLIKITITATNFIRINDEELPYKNLQIWEEKLKSYFNTEKPWLLTILVPEDIFTEEDAAPLLKIFEELNINADRYSFQQYRVSEFETLEKIRLK